ncbi:MAG: tRNA pseudouridine55 synthase [Parcubacteria group bacterium Athens0416_74]|nr:MAG: tRNA pseudouridine55 synthase [Parcubacteria group bacterium Athens0416_74]
MIRRAAIHKEVGETPLMALERFRAAIPGLAKMPLTYAGRLDPMASGALLILVGDECKRRTAYDGLDKEYVFEILFGIESDTGDILGLAQSAARHVDISPENLERVLQSLIGTLALPYPAYSSKTVDGAPLFVHARQGTLDDVVRPQAVTRVYAFTLESLSKRSTRDLRQDIEHRLGLLRIDETSENPYKDFRRDSVLNSWDSLLRTEGEYAVARIRATVSSGTYIRSLAPRIAQQLGTAGLAYSIERTRIGRYVQLPPGWGFWVRTYACF